MKPKKDSTLETVAHFLAEAEQLEADRYYQRAVLGDDYCDVDSELEAR